MLAFSFGTPVERSVDEREFVVGSAIASPEAVDRGKFPASRRRRQFVDRAATVVAAVEGSAVQIAISIYDDTAHWILPIALTLEGVKNGLFPGGTGVRNLVHHADAIGATHRGRAIQSAIRSPRYCRWRIPAVVSASKVVDRVLRPFVPVPDLFKDRAISVEAALASGSIKIAAVIEDHPTDGLSTIAFLAKLVDLNFPTGVDEDFEVGAEVSPAFGSSKQSIVGGDGQRTERRPNSVRAALEAIQRKIGRAS